MAKILRTAALVVGAVALVATGIGAAVGTGTFLGVAGSTFTTIGTIAGVAAGVLGIAAQALTKTSYSSSGNPTTFTTNPQSGLPYAMGRTRMSGLRIAAGTTDGFSGKTKNDLLCFGAMLSIGGQIEGIESFTADNEAVSFMSNGNAIGRFKDYMAQKVWTGGAMATALALSLGTGSFPAWGAQHKLSGITHALWMLRFETDGSKYGAGAPEPAWVGKWVKVYDPRKDSTYPGGSGSHRALNESTYEWSDNPGLHALTWALGRWQNGKRTCGIGAPIDTIRVADFVECANVCEANGWKVGGVEWTTDSKWDSLKRILQAGGAVPTQTGAMIGCRVSMPRTAIATIDSRHLHDSLSIAMTKSRRDRFNTVIPRYVNEDNDWAVISGTAITVPDYVTTDKGQRTKEIDYPLVQVFSGANATQPGQLAAYDIVNSREGGPITFTTGPEWLGLKTGDVVYLNVPEEGLDNQPILITRRSIDPSTGKVSFAADTETYSKHAFALGQSTTPPSPFRLSAPDLKAYAPDETTWSVSGVTSGEGFPALLVAGVSEYPSADSIVIDYRLHDAEAWTNSAIVSAIDPVRHVISPLESEALYDVRIAYRVGTIDGNTTIFTNVRTGVGKITIIEGRLDDQAAKLAQLDDDAAAAKLIVDQAVADIRSQGSAIDTIEASVETNADKIQLLVDQISALDGDAMADLSSKLGVMVSDQESVAGSVLAMAIKTSQQSAAFSSERTLRVNSEEAIARLVDAVAVRMGSAEAGLANEVVLRAAADQALSTLITTLTASVNGNTASISQQSTVLAQAVGDVVRLFARAALTVEVGGLITGWETNNNGETGDFAIRADRLRLLTAAGGTKTLEARQGTLIGYYPNGNKMYQLGDQAVT